MKDLQKNNQEMTFALWKEWGRIEKKRELL